MEVIFHIFKDYANYCCDDEDFFFCNCHLLEDDDFFLRSLAPALDKTDPDDDDVEGSDESLTKVPGKKITFFSFKTYIPFFFWNFFHFKGRMLFSRGTFCIFK